MSYQINWTPESKEKALDLITQYLLKHGIGECIMQSDDAIIEAPDLLSEIADFEGLVEYIKDEN